MAKRRKEEANGVSLFPFMSILACLIGILTLMISINMQLNQMDRQGKTEEEVARAKENQALQREARKLEERIKQLDEKVSKEKVTVAEMAKVKEKRILLDKELEELKKAEDPDQTDAELQKIIENLRKQIAVLVNGRPPLVQRLEELRALLSERKAQPKPEQSVVVQPGGVGVRTAENLFFIECNSTGIVLLPEDGEPVSISTDAIVTSPEYHKFLDEIKGTRDSMALFLIRRSGDNAFRWAAGFAQSQYKVNIGKLPLPNDGKIDLSNFR